MGGICSTMEVERIVIEQQTLQYKLKQLQTVIDAEEKRNFKLLHQLDALVQANGDLIAKNKELVAERKELVMNITKSQKRLERLHKAFITAGVTPAEPT